MDLTDPHAFYNSLADDYHLMFRDWWSSARNEGNIVDKLLRARQVYPPASVLDCTCGIGTQALPLALLGYRVIGSDISERAIERARAEAARRDIDIELVISDVRSIETTVGRRVDAVISFDNALPHLISDDELTAALTSMRQCLRSNGLLLASIRDYDAAVRNRPRGLAPVLYGEDGARLVAGQAWEWSEDLRTMKIYLFMMKQTGSRWGVDMRCTTYRALQRKEMTHALASSGFENINWHEPADTGYFQPIVSAEAANG